MRDCGVTLAERLDAFFAHRLEGARVEVERLEDGRRDLGGEGGVLDDLAVSDARRG
jgi:hypothetical protein